MATWCEHCGYACGHVRHDDAWAYCPDCGLCVRVPVKQHRVVVKHNVQDNEMTEQTEESLPCDNT